MPKVTILGQEEFEVGSGTNLLTFIQEKGYNRSLPATCGGRGTCSTCAIRILKGGGDPNANEKDLLKDKIAKSWRLSCQVKVTDDLEIEVPGYEVAEAMDIDPALLADIIDYCAEHLHEVKLHSSQSLTIKRLQDLRRQTHVLVDGGGDAADFRVLCDLIEFLLAADRVREIPSRYPFTERMLEMMLKVFAKRIPHEIEKREEILAYPYYLYVVATVLLFLLGGLSIYALMVDAPLEHAATPTFTPNPEKAPWYFLGIQEMLAISPNLGGFLNSIAIGGVILPGVFVFIWIAIPFVEPYLEFWRKDRKTPPGRRLSARPITVFIFTFSMLVFLALVIIGTYFRGPNWEFVLPWN